MISVYWSKRCIVSQSTSPAFLRSSVTNGRHPWYCFVSFPQVLFFLLRFLKNFSADYILLLAKFVREWLYRSTRFWDFGLQRPDARVLVRVVDLCLGDSGSVLQCRLLFSFLIVFQFTISPGKWLILLISDLVLWKITIIAPF